MRSFILNVGTILKTDEYYYNLKFIIEKEVINWIVAGIIS